MLVQYDHTSTGIYFSGVSVHNQVFKNKLSQLLGDPSVGTNVLYLK